MFNYMNFIFISKKITYVLFISMFFVIFMISYLISEVRADNIELSFKGILVAPPTCTLNDGSDLFISFGNSLSIKKIQSGTYRQPVDIGIKCEENTQSMQLRLSWSGIAASFDADNASVVSNEQPDLGIKLYVDGIPFELNTPLSINSKAPEIEAVLVQQEGVKIDEGTFSANATIRAEYQ